MSKFILNLYLSQQIPLLCGTIQPLFIMGSYMEGWWEVGATGVDLVSLGKANKPQCRVLGLQRKVQKTFSIMHHTD